MATRSKSAGGQQVGWGARSVGSDNYYKILGLERPPQNLGEAKSAWRTEVKRMHPDKVGKEFTVKMVEVNLAWDYAKKIFDERSKNTTNASESRGRPKVREEREAEPTRQSSQKRGRPKESESATQSNWKRWGPILRVDLRGGFISSSYYSKSKEEEEEERLRKKYLKLLRLSEEKERELDAAA